MFDSLDRAKPGLKKLIAELRKKYAYASVLAVADDGRTWTVSRGGTSIRTRVLCGGTGFVVRIFDETGCAEYSFNEFSQEAIPHILSVLEKRLAEQKAALPDWCAPLPTPIPQDEPAFLCRTSEYRIDPRELGDDAILAKLHSVREKGMAKEGILDVYCFTEWQCSRKLFLSGNRDLDQTVMWMTGDVVAFAPKGEEILQAARPYSVLGGAEVLDELEDDVGEITDRALELLQSEPVPPGEYECVCDPDVTGLIVHEAFGHGVEMDMFVKDRALASRFVGEPVASGLVTMHDGNAINESATMFFDDEGTLTGDTVVIDKGILAGGICDALSASRLGVKPTGNGRRESYERKAYTRMTNTYFSCGRAAKEEMIASVSDGFLLEMPLSGMEDPKNWGIQCMVNVAREIKDGKLTGKVYSPVVLTGYVPDLLKSVSMMSESGVVSGSGYCGKGYKELVKVSSGGPYMKARVRLG